MLLCETCDQNNWILFSCFISMLGTHPFLSYNLRVEPRESKGVGSRTSEIGIKRNLLERPNIHSSNKV